MKETNIGKWLKLFLKIAVTVACLWYVSGKIDFAKAGAALQKANWFYLLFALIAFVISKWVAAIRLNIYFRNIDIHLPAWKNIRLYWLGMFYNLFLPGSISGDAYKVILLTKKYGISYKKTTTAVLLDRFSGLLGLGLILAVYGFVVLENDLYITIIIAGAVLSVLTLYFIIKFWLKEFIPGFLPTLLLGILVQVSQVICVYCILLSLHLPIQQSAWIFIFLVAAVITVLPISFGGGLGTREFVFREGALFFLLDPSIAVVISLLFYLCTLIGSLPALYFVFNDPLTEKNKPSR
ncbi:MAG TPA: lysylphosphatidylglycerol synthase transmembrane domain-containing protein [Chitinophagaceae bacterium]|nr:lysylphosphatidylglycerol synthase transmembrane domain-containing protein [Chitinophagaceae bacterium]